MTTRSNSNTNDSTNDTNLLNKDQIPTEYNEEQTLRFLRRQNRVAGEERVKTISDIPIAATLAQVLKDLVFLANKKSNPGNKYLLEKSAIQPSSAARNWENRRR